MYAGRGESCQKMIRENRECVIVHPFDSDVLTFLKSKNIRLFITPPDTTGVTQLLDQINQKLHSEYRSAKSVLYSSFMTINRGFMNILAELWPEWVSKQTIMSAG